MPLSSEVRYVSILRSQFYACALIVLDVSEVL